MRIVCEYLCVKLRVFMRGKVAKIVDIVEKLEISKAIWVFLLLMSLMVKEPNLSLLVWLWQDKSR